VRPFGAVIIAETVSRVSFLTEGGWNGNGLRKGNSFQNFLFLSHSSITDLVALLCLSEIYEQQGDSTAAKASIDQMLVVTRRMLQSSQPQSQSQPQPQQYPQRDTRRLEIGALITRMARFYLDRQQHDVALELYRESLSIMTSVLGIPQHDPSIIVTMLLISEIHHCQKDHSAALNMALQALERQKLQHGECSAPVAGTLRWIGSLHGDYDDLDGALQYYQDALVMQRVLHGDDSLQVSDALTDVGAVLCKSEKIHDALQVLTVAWENRVAQLGRNHQHVSFSVCNIGVCHMMQGSYAEAIACFAETLRVEQVVLGDGHRNVALTLNRLGDAHKKNGDMSEALRYIQRALSIERVVLCHEPTMIAGTLSELGNLHLVLGDATSMMAALIESARLYLSVGRDFTVAIVTTIPPLYDLQLGPAASAA
jgi:tetratricopeptide (TPR) repeat protein